MDWEKLITVGRKTPRQFQYTMSQKTDHTLCSASQTVTDFQNFFTAGKIVKFGTKPYDTSTVKEL